MPCDSGCALVVVQHLSPDFRSLMDDLLARHTQMRIHRVVEGMELERDCIYLIPPRKLMTVRGGCLALTEREAARQLDFPINVFLDSLAVAYGPQAVAIVLSGTGTDGTQGARAIHEAGGLVIAQSLDSADFNGMPRSVINTELADYILPPERMPEALVTYARYPHLRMAQNARPLPAHEAASHFGPVLEQLRRAYGIDFGEYKLATVQRRIHRRMSFLQLADVPDYARLLTEDAHELDELYKDLLIGVTEFLRDPEAFEALGRDVLPMLLSETGREELRVWVAGCATGEEAYSIAILIDEQARAASYTGRIAIFATDMHRDSLTRAANGVYERARLANLGQERINRYFRPEADGLLRIVPELRQRIIFSAHNVVSDPPFTKIDLLTCRNMLIYFQLATQERVLALFHFALRRGGTLFLGSSEGLGSIESGFVALAGRHKLYRKTADTLIAPPDIRSLTTLRPLRPLAGNVLGAPQGTIAVSRALLHAYDFLLKQTMPPSLLVSESGEIVQYFDQASRYLLEPEGRSHDNLFNRTTGDLRLALSTLIPKAIKTGETASARGLRHVNDGQEQLIDVHIKPIPDARLGSSLVQVIIADPRQSPIAPATPGAVPVDFAPSDALHRRISDLETELNSTKENLQSTVEELQTSNEELQATNEEMLAANEELQSTNEELHSVNEELYTVNAEFERKNHELKLVGEDLSNLLSNTDIGTLFLDRHLRIRRFTPAIARIFHLLPQDIGRPIEHIASQLDGQPDLPRHLRAVLAQGEPLELEIRTREGHWLFQRMLPFHTAEGTIDGVVMTFTDISGVKSIQDKLNLALEFSRTVWWEWDLRNQILHTHTGGQQIFGFEGPIVETSTAEWLGQIHPDDRDRVQQKLESCLSGEAQIWESQHRFLTRDGQWRWVVNKGRLAARDPGGRPIRMLGTTQDIHERCLAEQEIKKLNLALERSPVMVMMTDLDGRIEYVNQQFTEITGYTAREVIGQLPRMLKGDGNEPATFDELWASLKRGETWQGELHNRRKDGSAFRERATIGPLRDSDGTVTHYIALKEVLAAAETGDDGHRRMEERLTQIQKMETLGALAGGIAHDFNNILTAIICHTELAADLAPAPSPVAECLQQVKQASWRASDLVQRILTFSRRGSNRRDRLDLSELVTEAIPLLRASLPSTVQVEVTVAQPGLAALANHTDLQQIVLNLGSNGAHAMRERGGILVIGLAARHLNQTTRMASGSLPAGDYVRLQVKDTGTGIPDHVLSRMFEPFFTTKPAGEGTGLGLSIILGIVLAYGGAVDVQTQLGAGTTFDVYLPALTSTPPPKPASAPGVTTGHGERIAFVDDEPSITLLAKRGLTRYGYQPVTFDRAHELLDHLANGQPPFALIVTDQTMPGMTGLEMIRQLRAGGNRTPIIILSGNARFVTDADLAGLGDVHFIPKPFVLGTLSERIAAMIQASGSAAT